MAFNGHFHGKKKTNINVMVRPCSKHLGLKNMIHFLQRLNGRIYCGRWWDFVIAVMKRRVLVNRTCI
jgi:hypothetical protein